MTNHCLFCFFTWLLGVFFFSEIVTIDSTIIDRTFTQKLYTVSLQPAVQKTSIWTLKLVSINNKYRQTQKTKYNIQFCLWVFGLPSSEYSKQNSWVYFPKIGWHNLASHLGKSSNFFCKSTHCINPAPFKHFFVSRRTCEPQRTSEIA